EIYEALGSREGLLLPCACLFPPRLPPVTLEEHWRWAMRQAVAMQRSFGQGMMPTGLERLLANTFPEGLGDDPEVPYFAWEHVEFPFGEVLAGRGDELSFPKEPEGAYLVALGFSRRPTSIEEYLRAFSWLVDKAGAQWMQLWFSDVAIRMRMKGL